MFELIDYKPEHAEQIEAEGANEPTLNCGQLPKGWAQALAASPAKTAVYDGKIVGCGGVFIWWPGMAEAWATFIHDIGKYPIDPRIVGQQLHQWMEEYKLNRVQSPLRADWEDGIKYAKWLGFRPDGWPDVPDGVRMEHYHYDGTAAIMYSIIRKKET